MRTGMTCCNVDGNVASMQAALFDPTLFFQCLPKLHQAEVPTGLRCNFSYSPVASGKWPVL